MGDDGDDAGGSWQKQNACYPLTAMLSADGRQPPPLRSVTSCLLELYHMCLNNIGWARVLYDARGSLEKLTIICKIPPAPNVTASPQPRKPGRPASESRRARERRRETWAELNRSQPRHHTPPQLKKFLSRPRRLPPDKLPLQPLPLHAPSAQPT
jgi:hypothetical protein